MTGPPEVRDDVAARSLRVHGREVRLLERGAGPPVVLVHGLGLTAGIWRPHIHRLADAGYRVLAPDLPGFGHSEGPVAGLSIDAAAAWLGDLAGQVGVHGAAWVGHSVGAQQIVRLAARDPDRVGALVLAAPTGRAGRHMVREPLGLLTTAFQEEPRVVGRVLRRYFMSPLSTVGTWVRAQRPDLALDAVRVRSPTLLVAGERDVVVPDDFLDFLLQLFPDASLHRIEGATHAVALDPLEPFLDALIAFLARRYRSGVRTDL
jgi:pimeloyl-ACP methyl ester carboxylesterase